MVFFGPKKVWKSPLSRPLFRLFNKKGYNFQHSFNDTSKLGKEKASSIFIRLKPDRTMTFL